MEGNILVSIKIAELAEAFIHFPIKIATGAHGRKTNFQEMASTSMSQDRGIRASSLMERNMAKEFIITEAELFLMGSGTKIENMVLVLLSIPIVRNTKETGSMDRNMEREFTTTKVGTNILVTG